MNSFRCLKNLSTLLIVSLLLIGCQSDTVQASSPDPSTSEVSTLGVTNAKLDLGAAGISVEPLESTSSGNAEIVFESLSPAPLVNIASPKEIKVVDVEVRWPDGTSKKSSAVDISQKVEIQQ